MPFTSRARRHGARDSLAESILRSAPRGSPLLCLSQRNSRNVLPPGSEASAQPQQSRNTTAAADEPASAEHNELADCGSNAGGAAKRRADGGMVCDAELHRHGLAHHAISGTKFASARPSASMKWKLRPAGRPSSPAAHSHPRASMIFWRTACDTAPVTRSTSSPPLMKRTVGIARIP